MSVGQLTGRVYTRKWLYLEVGYPVTSPSLSSFGRKLGGMIEGTEVSELESWTTN